MSICPFHSCLLPSTGWPPTLCSLFFNCCNFGLSPRYPFVSATFPVLCPSRHHIASPAAAAPPQLLSEMREKDIHLSARSFTLAMAACLESHRDRRVEVDEAGLQDQQRKGQPPAADLRLSEAALSLFDQLVEAGETPSASTYALALKVRHDAHGWQFIRRRPCSEPGESILFPDYPSLELWGMVRRFAPPVVLRAAHIFEYFAGIPCLFLSKHPNNCTPHPKRTSNLERMHSSLLFLTRHSCCRQASTLSILDTHQVCAASLSGRQLIRVQSQACARTANPRRARTLFWAILDTPPPPAAAVRTPSSSPSSSSRKKTDGDDGARPLAAADSGTEQRQAPPQPQSRVGVRPWHLASAMAAFDAAGDWAGAQQLWGEALRRGVSPRSPGYAAAVSAAVRAGDTTAARRLVEEARGLKLALFWREDGVRGQKG